MVLGENFILYNLIKKGQRIVVIMLNYFGKRKIYF